MSRVPCIDQLQCSACEGIGRVVDLSYSRPRRVRCHACGGAGWLDAGVWPYRGAITPRAVEASPDGEWRPIETAPKDGSEILLGAAGRVTFGYWLKPSDVPRIKYQDGFAPEEEWDDFEPSWMSWDGGFTEEAPPTHWMPLPAPPRAVEAESKRAVECPESNPDQATPAGEISPTSPNPSAEVKE